MHRKIVALTIVLIIAASLVAAIISANAATDFTVSGIAQNPQANNWQMFRYSAANEGSPDNTAPIAHDLVWTAPTLSDQYAVCIVGSSPAIVDDVVYIGSDDGYLYAFNASSGAEFWRVMIGDSSLSSPVVAGGVVYVRDWYGTDCALNASTSQMLWKRSLGMSYSSPAVVNGVYYARTSGNVTALNAITGSVIWYSTVFGNGDGSPIVANNTVYIAESGTIYALDVKNGAIKWTQDLQFLSNTDNAPAVANGMVYVASGSTLFYALDAQTGTYIWNYSIGQSPHSNAVVSNGIVYVGSGHQGVFAFDAITGSKIWNYPTSPGMGSSIAVSGEKVYLAGNDGVMYELNASSGYKLWSYAMSNTGTSSSPSVAKGVLYIRNSNGYLYAFGKASQSSISLSPTFGLAGATSTLSGSGFTAGSTVTATFGGAPITLSNSNVDSLGHFSATITVPSIPPEYYQIIVTEKSGLSASATFRVVSAATTSWPMFMHDLQHSGTADNSPVTSHNLLWNFSVDRGNIMNSVSSSAAVVGGIVYDSAQNGFLYALDAYTGNCYWRFNLGDSVLSSPVVVNGVVYVSTMNGVYAVNAYTGAQIWKTIKISGDVSTPAVSGSMLYVGSFVEHTLYAFRILDGQLVWQYTTGDYVNSSPAVYGNSVYVGSDDGYLYALNAATGALKWKLNGGGIYPSDGMSPSPIVVNGVVYTSCYDGNVYALDAASGNVIWNHTTTKLQSIFASPTFSNGAVYISAGSSVFALNASNGDMLWKFSVAYPIQASPTVAAGVVYVGGNDGNLYALDAQTGTELWRYTSGSSIVAATAIDHGILYLGLRNGVICAIGTTDFTTPQPTPTASPTPTPSETTIQATTDNGSTIHLAINGNITGSQMSNVVMATNQSESATTLSFTLTGQSGTTGFSNITIPKSSVTYGTTPKVFIDGQPSSNQGYTQDSNNYYVWFTSHFSSHQISIIFTMPSSPSPTTSNSGSQGQSSLLEVIYGLVAAIVVVTVVVIVLQVITRDRRVETRQIK
jgi:outer membrane protein assembly factor BamB